MNETGDSVYDTIADLLERRGDAAYVGEPVSQKEHALQTARLAEMQGADDALIAAALLHDIGHLLVADADAGEDKAAAGIDTRHEDGGAAWLASYFPPEVTEPIRLHVAAKRYMCATDLNYRVRLSPASERSLQLQGGPMSDTERAEFESNPHYANAVRLRHWDDTAKEVGLDIPDVSHYRERILNELRRH